MALIRAIVLVVSLLAWLVIGLAMWIPLLVRATAVFIVAILHAALTNEPSTHAAKLLDKAMSFYMDGFRRIVEAFHATGFQSDTGPGTIHLPRLLLETLWALAFWSFTVVLTLGFRHGVLPGSPSPSSSVSPSLAAPDSPSPAAPASPPTAAPASPPLPSEAIARVYLPQLKVFVERGDSARALHAFQQLKGHAPPDAVPAVIAALRRFYRDSSPAARSLSLEAISLLEQVKAQDGCELLGEIAVNSEGLADTASKASARICEAK
jgi:hypothetical protein